MSVQNNLQALILCGGVGKRLRPLTDQLPKPLLEIRKGLTILDRQLLELKDAGLEEIFLLTGYLGEKIKERYKSNWQSLNIYYSEEEKPIGTLCAIKKALGRIKQDVLVRNGDIVSGFNLQEFIKKAQNSPYPATIAATKLRSPYGILKIEGERIVDFQEKPVLDFYINAGLYYFKKDSFPYFFASYPKEEKEIEKTVFPKLASEGKVGYYFEDCFWQSVDSFKDLERVRKEFEKRS